MNTLAARLFVSLLASILVLGVAHDARAEVTVADWRTPGDGLLTVDPATGLQWLDLSITRGFPWSYIEPLLGPGGPLDGFRRPTEAEVGVFWTDAGIPDVVLAGATPTAANFAPVGALQSIWGNAGQLPITLPGTTATLITTANSFDPVDNRVEGTPLLLRYNERGTAIAVLRTLLGVLPTEPVPYLSHALVRSVAPIPEPASLLLFAAGLAAGVLRWRAR